MSYLKPEPDSSFAIIWVSDFDSNSNSDSDSDDESDSDFSSASMKFAYLCFLHFVFAFV